MNSFNHKFIGVNRCDANLQRRTFVRPFVNQCASIERNKALLAVLLAKMFFPGLEHAGAVAGVAAVLGHIFPFYLKFKGGKGTASFIGMTLALNWKLALALFVVLALATVVTDYIVVGTVLVVISAPAYYAVTGDTVMALILAAASVVMLWKHRVNYVRIYKGTEVGLRSAARGDHRVK